MPLVQAVPGLVIPADMTTARLLVRPPPGLAIMQMDVEPAGALEVGAPTGPINGSWFSVPVAVASGASSFGRVRVSIVYGSAASRSAHNGAGQAQLTQQSVHLFTTPALPSLVNSYAQFTEAKVFFTDDTEPFGRGHSFMGWDASVNGIILQEDRAFIAGEHSRGCMEAEAAACACCLPITLPSRLPSVSVCRPVGRGGRGCWSRVCRARGVRAGCAGSGAGGDLREPNLAQHKARRSRRARLRPRRRLLRPGVAVLGAWHAQLPLHD